MSSQYAVAEGHNVAQDDLTRIDPQPTTRGIQYTERIYNLDGSIDDVGPFCELLFSVIETESDYLSLLAQFGLDDHTSNPVTVYLRNERLQYARYNAIAVLPSIGQDGQWQDYFLRNVVILLTNIELSA